MTIVKEKWRRFIRCPLSHSLFIPPSRQIQSVDDPRLCSVMNNNVWHRCFDMKNVIFNSCGAKREQRKIHRNSIVSAALPPGRRAMTVFIPGLQPSLQTSHHISKRCIGKLSQSTDYQKAGIAPPPVMLTCIHTGIFTHVCIC